MKMVSRRTFLGRTVLGIATGTLAGHKVKAQANDVKEFETNRTLKSNHTAIIIDSGPFPSIEVAAYAEAEVNWNDPFGEDVTACTQCFAAMELQHYLRKMTGEDDNFSVITPQDPIPDMNLIYVGYPDTDLDLYGEIFQSDASPESLADLGTEGYRIKSDIRSNRRIISIYGGSRVGTLYGVYDFLHRLGCRWFAPGELHEEIPALKFENISDMSIKEIPDFALRGFHAWENRGNEEFIMWMARNRMNYWCVEQSNHPYLRKLGIKLVWGEHTIGFSYLQPNAPYPYAHAQFPTEKDLPPDPYPVSPDFMGDADGNGVLSYREAHPEWYAMNPEGERVTSLGNTDYNYCTSNPHATAELMKNAVQELIDGAGQNAEFVNCWTVDDGKWCHCDACQALGSPTDRNILFVHAFDKAVKAAQQAGLIKRPITLLFLVYLDVLDPPTRPLPEDFDYETCIATYFPIVRSYAHTIDDPNSPTNSNYMQHLYGWADDPDRMYRGSICIGEYYNVSGYKNLPIVFKTTMQNDIPWYYKTKNARYFHYMHVTTKHWGNKALTNYQMARQIWCHNTDCPALWQDYFSNRYGDSAGDMHEFYNNLEIMLANCTDLKYGLASRLSRGDEELFPYPTLQYAPNHNDPGHGPSMVEILNAAKQCRNIIDNVLAQGNMPSRIRARIEEDEHMFTYGEQTILFYDALVQAYFAYRNNDLKAARVAYDKAIKIGDVLREETEATSYSSSHANASNAFLASLAGSATATLMMLIGPADILDLPKFNLEIESAVFMGNDFQGGGAMLHGYGLSAFPGRIHLTDNGNYVYSSTATHNQMAMFFTLETLPQVDIDAEMVGMICPAPPGGSISGEILVNDTTVFGGNMPFAEDRLTNGKFTIPPNAFIEGMNRLTVKNTTPGGHTGGRPWFGIHKIELLQIDEKSL